MNVFLIDGHSLLFRAHYAFIRNPLKTSKGQDTSALFGFFSMFNPLIKKENPDLVIIAFDVSRKTFRTDKYEEYKANRSECPDEIKQQTPLAKEILQAMGYPVVELENYEADDVIGTLAKMFGKEGHKVTIVTGDRDSLQLVDKKVSVLLTKKGIRETALYTPEAISKEFELEPLQLIDVKGLQGDSSDNIPGVPGVGPKTALKLIQQFGNIEAVYENIDTQKGKLKERLVENKDLAFLSRDLGRICLDAPVVQDLKFYEKGPGSPDDLLGLFSELELTQFATDIKPTETGPSAEYIAVVGVEAFEELKERLTKAERVAIDTETTSEIPLKANLVGISFCFEAGRAYYLPIGHIDITSKVADLPPEKMLTELKPLLERDTLEIIGHNAKFDYKVLKKHGIEIKVHFDTILAAYVLNPARRRFGLDILSLEVLHHKMVSFKDVVGKLENFSEVPLKAATAYAGDDAEVTLRLAVYLEKKLQEANLADLFYTLEMPLMTILAEMELAGISLDTNYLHELGDVFAKEIIEVEKDIFEHCGEEFNLNSPRQLAQILFEKLDLPVVKKTKTGPSTDAFVLETLEKEYGFEIARKINRHRHLMKLKGTYVDPLPALMGKDNRLHTTFHQYRTETGRLSSSDPNLQNIPIRTDDGKKIRRAFITKDENHTFVSADYSQIELRMLAHLSNSPILRQSFESGRDIHRETAAKVFGVPADEVSDEMRSRAKAVNFGIIYGQTGFGLSRTLGIPQKEAKAMITTYFDTLPEVQAWVDKTVEQARKDGFVNTLLGRRRFLPDINSRNFNRRKAAERVAINTVIQGTAADLIKKAMLLLDDKLHNKDLGAQMLLQIHDELIIECPKDKADRVQQVLVETMESAFELAVPITASVSQGDTWAHLK